MDIRHALPSTTKGSAEQGRGVVELGAMHVGADDLREAVVRRRSGVESAEREAGNPLVDLLRY